MQIQNTLLPLPPPPNIDLESRHILKKCALAHRYLAELKGYANKIPNPSILINAIGLQEAKDSSAIESIITTYDELYRVNVFENDDVSPQAKEVKRYAEALMCGYEFVQKQKFLTVNNICAIQRILENNNAGLRS